MGYQGFFEILMITLISSKNLGACRNMKHAVLRIVGFLHEFDIHFTILVSTFILIAGSRGNCPKAWCLHNKFLESADFWIIHKQNHEATILFPLKALLERGMALLALILTLNFFMYNNQSCSVSKETYDIIVTRGMLWSNKV